ncbi:MAG: FAD-dependent oxidoreductase, partial [Gemmatimonadota bacterium]
GLAGSLRVPDDSVLYPPTMTKWLLHRAARHGARVLTNVHVQEIVPRGVIVDGRRIDAALVVNASGAAAAQLTPGLDIVPRKGHLVITDRYPGFCRHQLVELGYLKSAHTLDAASVAFNLQPRRTGQLLIGSSRELVGWDASMNREVLARMLKRAIEFTPRLPELRAVRTWTAFRPATPDKLPYVGPWQPQEGVWVAAGHEGLGITTALGSAAVLSDLVAGRTPAIDPTPYSPARALAGSAS